MKEPEPAIGDTFWTMLKRVSKSNNIVVNSPYDRNVFVNRDSIESRTSIEVPPRPVRGPTRIDPRIRQAAFVKVTSVNSRISAEVLPEDDWPNWCPRDLPKNAGKVNPEAEDGKSYFENRRQKRVEWNGTKQTISDKSAKSRNDVFSGDDIRGSKNDLL